MTHATPLVRAFARLLMADEMNGVRSPETSLPAAFSAHERLRLPMAKLMGSGGFRALLLRALTLAGAEHPWMRALRLKTDGALEGFERIQPPPSAGELREGGEVLLAQLLGLLVNFIGPGLTSHLLGEIWPNISAGDLHLRTQDKNEENN